MKVVPDFKTGCLLWKGRLSHNGYGLCVRNKVTLRVHRMAYERAYGQIPAGLVIDHLCRTRNCVNPVHMEVVTRSENVRRGHPYRKEYFFKTVTHCKRGHEFTPENTGRQHNGRGKFCRECKRMHDWKYR